jgi:hypothetical protein
MARPRLVDPTVELMTDEGAVLFSFARGEQREFPVDLDFVSDVTAGFDYEAVIVEAANVAAQTAPPETIQAAGVQTSLVIRVPVHVGPWVTLTAYNLGEVCSYDGSYYRLMAEVLTDAIVPANNTNWEVTNLRTVYIQFASTVSSTWSQSPVINVPVYGFFELRVTEPVNNLIRQTWKPVRGLIEILFSPTDIVADV